MADSKENQTPIPPILDHATDEPSVFVPENLLERAASMQGRHRGGIPSCCLLDFDGELVPVARERFGAKPVLEWPCFHTTLLVIERDGFTMGLIGGTVGAPFAMLEKGRIRGRIYFWDTRRKPNQN